MILKLDINVADYVIVGGGIYGCTVAWELAKAGEDALLLEAKSIASGASGGLGERGVRASGRDLRELPLMRLAYDIWPDLHEQVAGVTGYRRLGHLLLIEREVDLAGAAAQVWMQNQQRHRISLAGCRAIARAGAAGISEQRDRCDLLPEGRRG